MTAQCPKYGTENPSDPKYCKESTTPLPFLKDLHFAHTKTLKTSVKSLGLGTLFAGRHEVLQELGRGGMGEVYRVIEEKEAIGIAKQMCKGLTGTHKLGIIQRNLDAPRK